MKLIIINHFKPIKATAEQVSLLLHTLILVEITKDLFRMNNNYLQTNLHDCELLRHRAEMRRLAIAAQPGNQPDQPVVVLDSGEESEDSIQEEEEEIFIPMVPQRRRRVGISKSLLQAKKKTK